MKSISPRFIGAMIVVLLAATLTAFSGNNASLPIDTHEVFVARTTEEMLARGSFIVPYLNDQPRLKKPPLCYWLVMGVDRLNAADGVITEAEARLPSALAGIVLVGLTIALGCVLFNQATGLLAGLVLASTGCFATYTHSARPEMVYAMFCGAGILGFAIGHQRHQTGNPNSKCFTWFAWLMMGLAMLTKGPQLPLAIVVGWMIAMMASGKRREIVCVLRPISGLFLFALVSLWWYAALWWAVPQTASTLESETLVRIFDYNEEPLTRYFDPYYPYRTAQLMLPWAVLFVPALLTPWLKELKSNHNARLLWWLLVVPMAVLYISLGRRDYYMLPLTGVAAVLMAAVGVEIGRSLWLRDRKWLWTSLAALHIIGLAAGIAVLFRTEPVATKPDAWAVVAVAATALVALVLLHRITKRADGKSETHSISPNALRFFHPSEAIVAATLVVGVAFFAAASAHASLWGTNRMAHRDFAIGVRDRVPLNAPLLGWHDIWEVQQYYGHRTIPSFEPDSKDALIAVIQQNLQSQTNLSGGECWLLISLRVDPRRAVLNLPPEFRTETVFTGDDGSHRDVLQLWRITNAP